MPEKKTRHSPSWGSTTKLVIALTLIALAGLVLWKFSNLVVPLMMVFILAYLFHPIVAWMGRAMRVSWKAAVNILYLLIILITLGLIALGGVGLVHQVQSLIASVQGIVADLPAFIESFSGKVYEFGPFKFDMRTINLDDVTQQALSLIQPLLGRTGDLVGALAGGAAEVVGWTLFVFSVSYFVMIESSGMREDLFKIDVPGYAEDIRRLSAELARIWNAFLRGQIIIFLLATIIYAILLPILGVSYALGIALMAGLAKFLPYIGPAITWVVMGLVTFFQADKPFDTNPFLYTLIVVGLTLSIDQVIDSLIAPRIMASALKVHPAAVLVAVLVAASLFGLLGVVIAAPLLATFMLFGRYTARKMFDLDPWPGEELNPAPAPETRLIVRLRRFLRRFGLRSAK